MFVSQFKLGIFNAPGPQIYAPEISGREPSLYEVLFHYYTYYGMDPKKADAYTLLYIDKWEPR